MSNLTGTQPDDSEVRPHLKTLTTKVGKATNLETHRFNRFSEWLRLVRAVMPLITVRVVRNFRKNRANKGTALRSESVSIDQFTSSSLDSRRQAEIVIIKSLQNEAYGEEIQCIQNSRNITKGSVLSNLSPIIDPRLEQGELTNEEKHSVILPRQHHVTTLVVEHLHHEIKHQG